MGISGVTELQGCNPGRPCRVAWCVCTDDDDTAAEASISDVSGCADSIDAQVRTVLGRVLAQRRSADAHSGTWRRSRRGEGELLAAGRGGRVRGPVPDAGPAQLVPLGLEAAARRAGGARPGVAAVR